MIWRLEYENAHGDVARLDIQRDAATPVEIIEGTENPFLLSYELEGKNKKGFIMSSFADISVYETSTFNIDDLKTSNETELSVKWYINNVLEWTGFVVPDFFSREIGEPAIVNLAASDRLSALKDSTLDGLTGHINMKDLLEACLEKTGLALPLASMIDFKTKINGSTIDFMYVVASAERLQDDKGKRISCYDILRSILVLSNSTIRQRNGRWTIYNKIQHEALTPSLNFDEVYQGAKRTIQPVFSSVGAFHEFGGGKRYPKNYDFMEATGWTPKNEFSYVRENREILGYTIEEIGPVGAVVAIPIYGAVTNNYQLFNRNNLDFYPALNLDTSPYLESSIDLIPYDSTSIGIECILTATGLNSYELSSPFTVNFVVIAESDTKKLILNNDGVFVPFSNDRDNILRMTWSRYKPADGMVTKSATFKGKLTVDTNVNDYKISIRIYGDSVARPTFIDSIYYKFKSDEDIGKGMLYRTEQIGVFSKKNDPETTIFGDYISNGLNGYFFPYPIDDTSILRSPADTDSHSRLWTTATDPDSGELPILQHVARQNSRMFGVAHNILSAVIDANTFDPLSNVSNCAGEKYVVVAATFDFLRSTVEVELQQIAYGTLERRDFIYNYFGGEDDGIRSIGAASSGGGTSIGGGGSFLDQYFTFDEDNDALIANVNLVSEKELAAYFDSGDLPSILDDLPVATATTLGCVKVSSGSGLIMNGEQLEIDGDTFNLTNYYTKTSIDAFFDGTTPKTGYNKSNWDSAYTDRLKWNGGSAGLNATTGRTSLGLGTAATKDVQTSLTDTTGGRLMEVGAFGLGVNGITQTDFNLQGEPLQFFRTSGTANNAPQATTYYSGIHMPWALSGYQQGWQLACAIVATNRFYARNRNNTDWTSWVELYHTGNLVNPVTGTGAAGRISYWDGTGSQTGSANFIWDNNLKVRGNAAIRFDRTASGFTGIEWWGTDPNQTAFKAAIRNIDRASSRRTGIGFYTSDIADWTTEAELRMSILRNGNVLIGTTTDSGYRTRIDSTDALTLQLNSSYTSGGIMFSESGTVRGYIRYGDNGNLFTGALTDSMNIRAEGALHLGAGGNNLIATVLSTGFAIGKTTVTSGYKLDVNGAIRAAGNIYATGNITGAGEVTAYTASDARLKTNITSLNNINALDIINALNPVTYTWNSRAVQLNGSKNTTSINYGLIAQELEAVVPDLIRPIYGDYKTYDDRGLMTIMLQAIKELKAEVDLLKNKN